MWATKISPSLHHHHFSVAPTFLETGVIFQEYYSGWPLSMWLLLRKSHCPAKTDGGATRESHVPQVLHAQQMTSSFHSFPGQDIHVDERIWRVPIKST